MTSTKMRRLRDFQLSNSLMLGEAERENAHVLFAFYERTRMWLQSREVSAPFGKILIQFRDSKRYGDSHGHVAVDLCGVCMVSIAVDKELLKSNVGVPGWIVPQIQLALHFIEQKLGWRSRELDAFIHSLLEKPFPYIHFFDNRSRAHKKSARTFTPWISLAPKHTEIGVRVSLPNGLHRDIVLLARDAPIWIEDDFPMSKTTFRDGSFLILDKNGAVLASIPIEDM